MKGGIDMMEEYKIAIIVFQSSNKLDFEGIGALLKFKFSKKLTSSS